MLRELANQNQASDDKRLLQPRSNSPASVTGHDGLISRSLVKIAALSRQLEDLQLEPDQEES